MNWGYITSLIRSSAFFLLTNAISFLRCNDFIITSRFCRFSSPTLLGCRELHQSWDRYRANLLELQDLDNAGGLLLSECTTWLRNQGWGARGVWSNEGRTKRNSDCCAWTLRASERAGERHNSVVGESEHRREELEEEGKKKDGGGALGPWAQKVQQHSASALSCNGAAQWTQSHWPQCCCISVSLSQIHWLNKSDITLAE